MMLFVSFNHFTSHSIPNRTCKILIFPQLPAHGFLFSDGSTRNNCLALLLLIILTMHEANRHEIRPLIGIRSPVWGDEQCVALLSRAILKWQGNQVSEAASRHSVLIGTLAALYMGPVTDTASPLVCAGGRVSLCPFLVIDPAFRMDAGMTAKHHAERG